MISKVFITLLLFSLIGQSSVTCISDGLIKLIKKDYTVKDITIEKDLTREETSWLNAIKKSSSLKWETPTWEHVNSASHPDGGTLHTVKLDLTKKDQHKLFEIGQVVNLLQTFPKLADYFDYKIVSSATSVQITYPDPLALEKIISKKQSEAAAFPATRFWVSGSLPVKSIDFARRWIHGRAPISTKPSAHFHDMFVHSLSYLMLPKDIAHGSREIFKSLLKAYDDPVIKGSPEVHAQVLKKIQKLVTNIDEITLVIQRNMMSNNQEKMMEMYWSMINPYQMQDIGEDVLVITTKNVDAVHKLQSISQKLADDMSPYLQSINIPQVVERQMSWLNGLK